VLVCRLLHLDPNHKGRSAPLGDPTACGDVSKNSGYGCFMKNLVDTWREAWSVVPNTTPADFPVGIVSLAGEWANTTEVIDPAPY
jgi:hypothetical protein